MIHICSPVMWSSRLSLAALFVLSSWLVVLSEEESCSKDGSVCGEEEKSLMLEAEKEAESTEDDYDEGVVDEALNVSLETSEEDDTEEVDGIFEPCTKSEKGGQLQRLMIEKAGYQLTESSSMTRVHCQPDSDDFFGNGYQLTESSSMTRVHC